MATVLDTVSADQVEIGDVIEYVRATGPKKGQSRVLEVTDINDTGSVIYITGIPDDVPGNDKVTVPFLADDYVDVLGS